MSDDTVIGVSRPRIDAPDKVTGATRFAADGYVHGLLHARPVLATEAHARIRGIDKRGRPRDPGRRRRARERPISPSRRPARTAPRSRSPARRSSSPVSPSRSSSPRPRPPPRTEPRPSSSTTSRFRRSSTSRPRWRPVLRWRVPSRRRTTRQATSSRSTPASTTARRTIPTEELSGNVLDRITRENGDVAAAFAASAAIVEGTFRTPWVYQAYLEPQVCTAWLEPSGTLVVSTSTQGSFVTQRELARAFDLPLERVRVIAEPLGGAFGGKFALVEPLAAGAALALKRPVRLVLTRSEDFQATNPASAQVTHLKIGARADGTLTGIEARMIVDRGSNAGWGVEGITSLLVAGPYNWEAHDLRGYGVQTNRFTFGAYRAPGRADRRLRPRVAPRRARGGTRSSIRSSFA